jgi:hypothetical protein
VWTGWPGQQFIENRGIAPSASESAALLVQRVRSVTLLTADAREAPLRAAEPSRTADEDLADIAERFGLAASKLLALVRELS